MTVGYYTAKLSGRLFVGDLLKMKRWVEVDLFWFDVWFGFLSSFWDEYYQLNELPCF